MKISTFLLLLTMQLSAAVSYSQEKVTLSLKEGKLTEVLKEIEGQTGYKVFYNNRLVEMAKPISLEIEEADLEDALNLIFKNQPLDYEIVEKTIVVKKKTTKKKGKGDNASTTEYDFEDPVTVTGKVTDPEGLPLPGVTIRIKGTQQGTLTDAEGNYSITTEETNTLVFSFVGMVTMEEPIGNRTTIDVTLQESATQLQDVVVNAGYYETTDRLKTGNIVKIEAKEIENQPLTSPIMALQGRVAGLDITPISGVPGGATQIEIRGRSVINPAQSSTPLYIIDGLPIDSDRLRGSPGGILDNGMDPLVAIDPTNIESIEVLKDADATAIYGSRGANGVILITTKKSKGVEQTSLDVNVYQGAGTITSKMNLLDREQYLEMRNEAFNNAGAIPGTYDYDMNGNWDTTRYTDWQKELMGNTSNITDIQMNVSGGNKNTSFRLGGNYHRETLVFPGDFGYNRFTAHYNMNHSSIDRRLQMNLSINYGVNNSKLFNSLELVNQVNSLSPVAPAVYDESGALNWQFHPTVPGLSTWRNPMAELRKTSEATNKNLFTNSTVNYKLSTNLSGKINLGYTTLEGELYTKSPLSALNPVTAQSRTAEAQLGINQRTSWIVEPQIDYQKAFKDHRLNILIGASVQSSKTDFKRIEGAGYTSDAFLDNLEAAPITQLNSITSGDYRYTALFFRAAYSFNNKYLINFTGRRDGSSRFGPSNRFGNFGALGVGWVFSEERIVSKNIPIISFGKLRASYGVTGSDQVGDYMFYNSYSFSGYYQGASVLSPDQLYNPDFGWEETKKLEFAIETGFWDDQIFLTASWYRNRSSNQLINYALPTITGFPTVLTNFDATVENTGLELTLRTVNIRKTNFSWETSVNFSIPRNKLVKFDDIENSSYSTRYKVGEPLSIQRLYTYQGVDPQTGLFTFQDINEDDRINSNDRQFGKPLQREYGGVLNTIQFKNFELSILFQVVFQQKQKAEYSLNPPGIGNANQHIDVLNRWQSPSDQTNVQLFTTSFDAFTPYLQFINSDFVIGDASFLRLKTLTANYHLPTGFVNKLKIQNARIYLQGQNLFTLTKYTGWDPETGVGFPPLKIISLGINVKF